MRLVKIVKSASEKIKVVIVKKLKSSQKLGLDLKKLAKNNKIRQDRESEKSH